MKVKQLSAAQAAALVPDGATVIVGGSGGIGVPDEILSAVAARFTGSGAPRDLTVVHTTGVGDFDTKGLGHLAHKGLLKRTIGGNYGPQPRLMKLIVANEVEAYNLPQGVLCQLYRAIAAKQPGVVTHVGLHTYMDPRQSGGRMNAAARGQTRLTVECLHLRRMAFSAASALLGQLIRLQHGGVSVEFRDVNYLVGALMQLLGIAAVAAIRLRRH